jgi:hypothetical protein
MGLNPERWEHDESRVGKKKDGDSACDGVKRLEAAVVVLGSGSWRLDGDGCRRCRGVVYVCCAWQSTKREAIVTRVQPLPI